MKTDNSARTLWMAQTAILAAIIILMAFTPLGYLRVGALSITFLPIPVVVGAILINPAAGAVLGGVFGLTSFAQCFGIDPFGTALFAISPILTLILTMVPRILMGLLVGLIFRALVKIDRTGVWSYAVASLSGALLNTVLFVGGLVWFFGNSEYLRQFGDSILAILGVLITVNALVEAIVTMVIGTMITKALSKVIKSRNTQNF